MPFFHEFGYANLSKKIFWTVSAETFELKKKNPDSRDLALECLGIRLIFSLNRLFMMPGFTVKYMNIGWCSIKSRGANFVNHNTKYLENRLAILKVFVSLFGHTLYRPNFGL
jgi:hypothetical protein